MNKESTKIILHTHTHTHTRTFHQRKLKRSSEYNQLLTIKY